MIVMLTIYIYNYPHIKEIGQNMCSNHIYCLHALNMSLHIFPRHGAAVPPYGVYRPNGQIFYATLIRKMMINQWILGIIWVSYFQTHPYSREDGVLARLSFCLSSSLHQPLHVGRWKVLKDLRDK